MPGLNEWDVTSQQLSKAHGYAARVDYHKDNARAQETMQLAREILKLARSALLIHLRFMEPALVRLAANSDESITAELATDGRYLYYNSIHVCRLFKRARELPARDYLHVTLHCVFRHLFVGRKLIGDLWDLACDIAVENLINELDIKSLYCERQEKQRWLIEKLREAMPRLTAERIYRWLIEQELPPQEIGRIRSYFYADDHRIWYNPPEISSGSGGDTQDEGSGGEKPDIGDAPGGSDELPPPEDGDGSGEGMPGRENSEPGEKRALSPQETERIWKDISERIEVDLDTASSSYGENAGDFVAALREVNREKVDYAAFLRRFAVLGENIQVNDDEFDCIFYTYGMKLYGKMPLIEPLEYETAFVFVDTGRELPDVPPWAIKIRMTPTEVEDISDR